MGQEGSSIRTILVVDDERNACLLAKTILERAGFHVITAADGVEAMDVFRREIDDIALVILDLLLPEKMGTDVFDELRAARPRLPIIISSVHDRQMVKTRLAGDRLTVFVQKPFQPGSLAEVVHTMLAA